MTHQIPTSPLPAQPSLEHLRKEAKARRSQMRAQGVDVPLSNVQLLVARQYGFSSWRALRAALETGPAPSHAGARPLGHHRTVARRSAWDCVEMENNFFRTVAMALIVLGMSMTYQLASHDARPASKLFSARTLRG